MVSPDFKLSIKIEVFVSILFKYTLTLRTLLKMGSYSTTMCQSVNLLSSILTILLTYPNNNTLWSYSYEPFLTV